MTLDPNRISALIVAASLSLVAIATSAQDYPSRPIRIIVPLAAGGPGDVLARDVGQRLSEAVGQPVIIENRPGANTNIGTEAVAKSAPDGYTLLATASTLTINPSLYPKLAFDPIRDFAPVTLIATTSLVLVTHPSLGANSVQELVAMAKAQPGKIFYGSAGNGSTLHLAGEMFNTLGGVKLVHVPYKQVTDAMNDLLGGRVSVMFPGSPIALPHVKAGKLRALATTGSKRTSAAPELPTIAEAGLADYEVTVWYGVVAPVGTPPAAVSRLNAEIGKVLRLPEIKQRWARLGADPVHNTPEEFGSFLRADVGRWAKVVRESGAKID